jgi:hypothetical protein
MSKVYSFRLDDDNPREAQARAVIDAWVREGYSLRYVIVEALIAFKKDESGYGELASIVEQLQDLLSSSDRASSGSAPETSLSNSFLNAVKNSIKLGVSIQE